MNVTMQDQMPSLEEKPSQKGAIPSRQDEASFQLKSQQSGDPLKQLVDPDDEPDTIEQWAEVALAIATTTVDKLRIQSPGTLILHRRVPAILAGRL